MTDPSPKNNTTESFCTCIDISDAASLSGISSISTDVGEENSGRKSRDFLHLLGRLEKFKARTERWNRNNWVFKEYDHWKSVAKRHFDTQSESKVKLAKTPEFGKPKYTTKEEDAISSSFVSNSSPIHSCGNTVTML